MPIPNIEFLPRIWEISGSFLSEVKSLDFFAEARILYDEEALAKLTAIKIQEDPALYQKVTAWLKDGLDSASDKRLDEIVKVNWEDNREVEYTKQELIGHVERRTMRMQKWLRIENMQVIVSFNYLLALFDAALADITKYLLQREPALLQTGNKQSEQEKVISYPELLCAKSIGGLIDDLIDKKVEKLSRGSTKDHIEFLKRCLKAQVLPDSISQDQIDEMRSTRNIYTHNKGIVNEIYIQSVNDSQFLLGELRVIDIGYFKKCANICALVIHNLNDVITQAYIADS